MKQKNILKWVFAAAFFIIQCFVVPQIYFYNIKIEAHWLLYILLFIYFFVLGDMKQLFQKLRYGLSSRDFLIKTIVVFCFSFAIGMVMIYSFSNETNPIYPLWQPLYEPLLWLWIPLYTILQPAVDNILYHKLVLGDRAGGYYLLAVIVFRTFAETGLFLLNKTSNISDNQMIVLALFSVNTIFSICYFTSKNESFSFLVESMYRLAMVITVLVGMPQLLIFAVK